MLIRTAVTRNAMLNITDAFLGMLTANVCWRVFVATIASITAVVVAHMTGHTAGVVITVQHKIFGVIEARWPPFFLRVALPAISGKLLV